MILLRATVPTHSVKLSYLPKQGGCIPAAHCEWSVTDCTQHPGAVWGWAAHPSTSVRRAFSQELLLGSLFQLNRLDAQILVPRDTYYPLHQYRESSAFSH